MTLNELYPQLWGLIGLSLFISCLSIFCGWLINVFFFRPTYAPPPVDPTPQTYMSLQDQEWIDEYTHANL